MRIEQSHWKGYGRQILATEVADLTPEEASSVPWRLIRLLEDPNPLRESVPEALEKVLEPLFEKSRFIERFVEVDRSYWSVRFANTEQALQFPCFGIGDPCQSIDDKWPVLAWASQELGTISLVPEQSGSAPLGLPLNEALEAGMSWFDPQIAGFREEDFVVLAENNGNLCVADISKGNCFWIGIEAGEGVCELGLSIPELLSRILGVFVAGNYVSDIEVVSHQGRRQLSRTREF